MFWATFFKTLNEYLSSIKSPRGKHNFLIYITYLLSRKMSVRKLAHLLIVHFDHCLIVSIWAKLKSSETDATDRFLF